MLFSFINPFCSFFQWIILFVLEWAVIKLAFLGFPVRWSKGPVAESGYGAVVGVWKEIKKKRNSLNYIILFLLFPQK